MPTTAAPNDDAHYLALKARDARFDGRFFTGVTSTGIYCRPVCKVRTPKRENCRFFTLAALAESAGFRPCLRCRPELAPGSSATDDGIWSTQDASAILARQAARLLDGTAHTGAGESGAQSIAARMGISERHLRRIFAAHWGVTPLQYLQTRRLLAAKQLLTDTRLSVTQVAQLSGFASLRRFHAAFVEHYRLQPTALRKAGAAAGTLPAKPAPDAAGLHLKASYRPPYDVDAMLAFLGRRSIQGVEWLEPAQRTFTRTLALASGNTTLHGWVRCKFEAEHRVSFWISETLAPALPVVLARLRALLDLDADPLAINACLGDYFAGTEGLRVPGTPDGFELAVRAILGQQVTVAAGITLTQRLVQRYGETVSTPWPALNLLFPSARTLSGANPQDLGALGIVRQRQQALIALAQAVADGQLDLSPGADVDATMAQLQALPGIGPWTANYIAMRALRWPDAFPASDVALHNAMGLRQSKSPALDATRAFAAWKPWRSYAVIRAWHTQATSGNSAP